MGCSPKAFSSRQNGGIAFRFPGKPESSTSISPFFLSQPQVKPASGGCGGATDSFHASFSRRSRFAYAAPPERNAPVSA